MSYRLVIVESPAKCKKIESFLGNSYKCVASFGHIRELNTKKGLKCIDVEDNYNPIFIESPSKKKNIKNLRYMISKCSEVILATDDDREGEAIAWHICQVFKLSVTTTKRIIFHEITKTAVTRAVANPIIIDMNKVNAQLARQVLDLLVGFTISPVLWKHVSKFKRGSLSAGRCQTPALRLVYDNQKNIEAHPGKTGYDITGYFTKLNLPFKLNKKIDAADKTEDFLEETVSHDHMLSHDKIRNTTKKAPIPLTTSAIQQKASTNLRFSPKQTMRSCQTLYEAGYITYMRTDSKTYAKEFLGDAKKYIEKTYGDEYVKPNLFTLSTKGDTSDKTSKKKGKKDKKTTSTSKKGKADAHAQEAHEAIRPTKVIRTSIEKTKKIGRQEINLYKLIWSHTVETCMADATYKSLKSKISAPMTYHYAFHSEQVVFPGWKIVNGYEKTSKEYIYLQKIKKTKPLKYGKIKACYSLFDLKLHYTEAKLIRMLEERGIGRPSTFSSLITKIQDRSYVKKQDVKGKTIKCVDYELIDNEIEEIEHSKEVGGEKNKMVITPTGMVVIEFLLKHFTSVFEYSYTKNMEDVLDVIAKGNKIWYTLCKSCYTEIKSILEIMNETLQESIKIDDNHTYVIGRYGPVIKSKKDGKTIFYKIKTSVSLDDIKKGDLSIADIIQPKQSSDQKNGKIGTYKNEDICVKEGKFGLYAIWNKKTYSLKYLAKTKEDISVETMIKLIDGKINTNPNVLRVLNDNLSIRKGKYGKYIFYKTSTMKKPKFLKLKGYTNDPTTCQVSNILKWIQETYMVA